MDDFCDPESGNEKYLSDIKGPEKIFIFNPCQKKPFMDVYSTLNQVGLKP